MKKDKILKGCGGMSGVQIGLHAPEADMQMYLYGTAKETEQMLLIDSLLTAPNTN